MPEELPDISDPTREAARKRAEDLQAFSIHLGVFIIVILGLFLIDLFTGPGWWFFFPAIAWGIGLGFHGWVVLSEQVFSQQRVETTFQNLNQASANVVGARTIPAGDVVLESATLIDSMRRSSRRIPNLEVRQEALALCASADQVLAVIEETPDEAALADDFLHRYLAPASSILADYSRLANRNIASARPTLEKVETHDIPMLSAKLDELYERLHRGSLIDLEVAREMLSLDIADWDDGSPEQVPVSGADRDARQH